MRRIILLTALATFFAGIASAEDTKTIGWEDLLPGGVAPQLPSHSSGFDLDPNAGQAPLYPMGVVSELDGKSIKIPGFAVPLDVTGDDVKSMLLVPYFGACIHLPPPPSNQVVYVKFAEPKAIESIWEPIWVTGTMTTEGYSSAVGRASYTLDAIAVEAYQY